MDHQIKPPPSIFRHHGGEIERSNQDSEIHPATLIEGARTESNFSDLPPQELVEEARRRPPGVAPVHQNRRTPSTSLIVGDPCVSLHRQQQLVPPELRSDENEAQAVPDPAGQI
jgi:hypothetical protein